MKPIRIDMNRHYQGEHTSVTIRADVLEFSQPSLVKAAEIAAGNLQSAVRAAPGQRWDRTGRLISGLHAVERESGASVLPPSDRLQQPEILARFAKEFLSASVLDANVERAIATAVADSITVRRGL